eukprot:maker-scaffold21_size687808-snap-gene-5.35 protein:Tk09843 transcript:maker-scaffold21_size687808-snap-gene-5.35-mRNA-1 annotation:"sprt-like domain-containing protein spartan"
MTSEAEDRALALSLQAAFDSEIGSLLPQAYQGPASVPVQSPGATPGTSLIAPEWEDVDPTPDLHALFRQYNDKFFWGRLLACEVKWSPRMTLCAGLCAYQRRSRYCSIRLSVPLLKLRPRKDFVETLLHEMIHAYLFVTDGNDDHDGHGPAFHEHMHRINRAAGTKISVNHYKTHWWKCNGPCQNRKPFLGMVKRSMNRAPGPNDRWFPEHQASCGGTFIKVKEPEGYGQKKSGKKKVDPGKSQKDIRGFLGTGKENLASVNGERALESGGVGGNIFGFGGTSFGGSSGLKTKGPTGLMVVKPGWKPPKDHSKVGEAINQSKSTTTASAKAPEFHAISASQVREQMRAFWSQKSIQPNLTTVSNVSSSTATKRKSSELEQETGPAKPKPCDRGQKPDSDCPVCGKKVAEREINRHLDDCLTREPLSSDLTSDTNPVIMTGSDDACVRICPKCKRNVIKDEFAFHTQ